MRMLRMTRTMMVMVVVTVTTLVTTLRLRTAAAWRSESSSGTLSSREVALTKATTMKN